MQDFTYSWPLLLVIHCDPQILTEGFYSSQGYVWTLIVSSLSFFFFPDLCHLLCDQAEERVWMTGTHTWAVFTWACLPMVRANGVCKEFISPGQGPDAVFHGSKPMVLV